MIPSHHTYQFVFFFNPKKKLSISPHPSGQESQSSSLHLITIGAMWGQNGNYQDDRKVYTRNKLRPLSPSVGHKFKIASCILLGNNAHAPLPTCKHTFHFRLNLTREKFRHLGRMLCFSSSEK